jgi:VIT1/CCC1 family predicted Fe2+/Mn2+ transporter
MDIVLWIIQGILAIKLVDTSISHSLRQKKSDFQKAIQKMGNRTPILLRITSFFTFLGAVGLILPGLLQMPGVITVICAGITSILFLISLICHIKSREKPKYFVSIVLLVLTAVVILGRLYLGV